MPQSGEAPIQGIRYLATSTNHPPPTNQNRRTKTPPTRPASPPSRYKIGPTSIEGRPTCFSLYRPPKKPSKTNDPEVQKTPPAPILRQRTEWRTVPGRRPNQGRNPLSLAPAVLFGFRFSFEEKWNELKRKETKHRRKKEAKSPQKGDLASFSMLGFNGISQQYRKQLPPRRLEPRQR